MVTDNWNHRIRELNRGEYVCADARMKFHFLELSRGQLARFVQYVFWYGELSHVVQKGRGFNCLNQCDVGYANMFRKPYGVRLNSPNMTVRDLILGIDCHR